MQEQGYSGAGDERKGVPPVQPGGGYRYQPPLYQPPPAQMPQYQPPAVYPRGPQPPRPPQKKGIGCLIGALIAGLAGLFFLLVAAVLLWIVFSIPEEEPPYNTPSSAVQAGAEEIPKEPPSGSLRDHYTELIGNGEDQVTVMVYMIGSDLEEDGAGLASQDIEEMLKAQLGDHVRLVLQTGGASSWVHPGIKGGVCQRFEIQGGQLKKVEDLGSMSMVEPEAVSDFIRWAAGRCPANRNILIFWDHGGGTAMGFGYDPYYPDDSLAISEIAQALESGGISFDLIGFDACLMGTVETAYALEPYADYLIASEEEEPATGWCYTRWLTELGKNSSLATAKAGQIIIDDFADTSKGVYWSPSTLSLVELRQIPVVYQRLCDYMENISEELSRQNYPALSMARANVRSYGDGGYEQVDIVAYTKEADYAGAEELRSAVDGAVVYTRNNIPYSYGIAMYFPYDSPEFYEVMLEEFGKIGYGGECLTFFDRFISILTNGQIQGGSSTLPQTLFGEEASGAEDYSGYSWYDENAWEEYAGGLSALDGEDLTLTDKGDYFALHLTDEDWEQITYMELQVLVEDGGGYVDLGADNVFEWDEDGDLIVDFDGYWVALEGQVVPFYAEMEEYQEDGSWVTYGRVPAILNGDTEIDIMIFWSTEEPQGYVAGYRPLAENPQAAAKGYRQFEPGDVLEFICDYYSYDDGYSAWYWGDPVVLGREPLYVSYEPIGAEEVDICFKLTDIYNRSFWTETVTLTYAPE